MAAVARRSGRAPDVMKSVAYACGSRHIPALYSTSRHGASVCGQVQKRCGDRLCGLPHTHTCTVFNFHRFRGWPIALVCTPRDALTWCTAVQRFFKSYRTPLHASGLHALTTNNET